MMKAKFYCTNCGRYLPRMGVVKEKDIYRSTYTCMRCGTVCANLEKVKMAMLKDYVDYLEHQGELENYE